jgi:hypothetical protein
LLWIVGSAIAEFCSTCDVSFRFVSPLDAAAVSVLFRDKMNLPEPKLATSLFLRTNLTEQNEARLKAAVDEITSLVGHVPAAIELTDMHR